MPNIGLLARRVARARHPRRVLVLVALFGGLLAAGTVPAAASTGVSTATSASATSAVSSHSTLAGSSAQAQAAGTAAFWTPARMKAARNLDAVTARPAAATAARAQTHPDGPAVRVPGSVAVTSAPSGIRPLTGSTGTPWTGSSSSPPATTSGKVFFTDHTGGGWVCSGSAINSGGKNVVFTAGHCVYGTAGGELPAGETWHSNWEFVPDYYYGSAPYGVWYSCGLWTLTNYINSGDLPDDIGASVMCTNNGQHIVNVVGGQGIEWNYPSNQYVYDFGYPAAAPFNGEVLDECDGYQFASPYISSTVGLACNFTGGSSGGPWLAAFGGTFGYLDGVNSFTLSGVSGEMFSPYFGTNAYNLYNAVANL